VTVTALDNVRYWYDDTASAFVAPGRASLPITTNARELLVYGQDQPTSFNTGVLWDYADLTEYNAPTTRTVTLPAGTHLQNQIIYGDVLYTATGPVLLENCWLWGGDYVPSGSLAIIDSHNAASTSGGNLIRQYITAVDCTLVSQRSCTSRDGVRGKRLRLYRCDISKVNDGIGTWIYPADGTVCDVQVEGCYVHGLVYNNPDYTNPAAPSPTAIYNADGTHNDGWQHQGGAEVWNHGNFFDGSDGTCHPSANKNPRKEWLHDLFNRDGFTWANGSGQIVNANVNPQLGPTVLVEASWFRGWNVHINIKATPGGPFEVKNTKHFRNTAVRPSNWASLPGNSGNSTWVAGDTLPYPQQVGDPRNENTSGYWIRGDRKSNATVTGINSGTVTAKWVDGPYAGQTMAEPRDSGIAWDAA
jgi:hypothetical protein